MDVLRLLLASAFVIGSVLAKPRLQIATLIEVPYNRNISTIEIIENHIFAAPTSERLPKNVIPIHYELEFIPILDVGLGDNYNQWTAPGRVTIRVRALTPDIQTITLNAHEDLGIDLVGLTVVPFDGTDGTKFKVKATRDNDKEHLILSLDKALTEGKLYNINIKFFAEIFDETATHGIFRSSFKDENGVDRYLATTHFSPTGARRAFPCFDEPNLKAIFKISIAYGSNYIALSNNAVEETQNFGAIINTPEWKINYFKETVEMSPYLVAFAVVPKYGFVQATPEEEEDAFKKPARIYGPAHLVSTENGGRGGGVYPADKATKLLTIFQRYTGIEYSLDKIDSIAISNLAAGAMENWGLNTYKTDYLMYYPGVSTEAERLLTTQILSHELIHQWFGNLVTCDFWDQIWLNEGFSNFFEFYGVAQINPEFEAHEYRQFASFQVGLKAEASLTAQPLVNNVAKPGAGSKLEDYIKVFTSYNTFQKGGSLLRMLEALLTPETFQAGLQTYLYQYKYKSVRQDALFTILTARGRADGTLPPDAPTVEDIMNTWTLQSGFPLVRAGKATSQKIFVSQERFTNHVEYNHEHNLNPKDLWTIPIAIASEDKNSDFEDLTPEFWMNSDVSVISYDHDTTKWIVINADAVGFYRVLYDETLFANLFTEFNKKNSAISVKSRAQIIDDYFSFADNGYDKDKMETALSLTKSLDWETNALVWKTVLKHLRGYYNKISDVPEVVAELKGYLLPKILKALTATEGGTGMTAILRSELFDWASELGDAGLVRLSKFIFNLWTINPKAYPLPVDIEPFIMSSAIAHADIHDNEPYVRALAKYQDPTIPLKQKTYLIKALGCSKNPTQLTSLLEGILGTAPIISNKAHAILVLKAIASNSVSRQSSIAFLQKNAVEIIEKLGLSAIVEYVKSLSDFVVTEKVFIEILVMLNDHEELLEPVKPTLVTYLKVIQENIQWKIVYCQTTGDDCMLEKWFRNNKL